MNDMPLKMSEIQQISLSVLKKVTSICEKNHFRYTLAYGTLIGAIRHNGFIPWDDDIDIQMPRPDYEALIVYLVKYPIENLKLFNYKYVKDYPLGISRIADMRYRIDEKITSTIDMGIFVDIYPIDGLADTYNDAKRAYAITDKPRANLLRMINGNRLNIIQLFRDPVFFLSGVKLKIFGLSRIQQMLEASATKYRFEDKQFVGVPNWNWIQLVYKRQWYEEFIKVKFEDGEFFISKYYDDILKSEYGDYMQLPPLEKRVYHHGYTAYKR